MKWYVCAKPRWHLLSAAVLLTAVSMVVLFLPLTGYADDLRWNTIGVRAGVDDSRNNGSFSQYEAFATIGLPFHWTSDAEWGIGSCIGFNAGVVRCEGDSFIASLGPALAILTPSRRLAFLFGIYPTYLDSSEFETDDFGAKIQFTSALNINFQPLPHLTIGYRIQHMSNAGISDENPGLNTHFLEVGYRF